MKKVGNAFVERVKKFLTDPKTEWRRGDTSLEHPELRITVRALGVVLLWRVGEIPLNWTQRRSVARSFKHAHARITEQLVKAGEQALLAQKRS